MNAILKSMSVPVGSFAIAMLIAFVTQPTIGEAKRRRADPTTGGCAVSVACSIGRCSTTFDPAVLKTEKQPELQKRADEAVAGCVKKNDKFLPKEIKPAAVAKNVAKGLKDTQDGKWDAYTSNSGVVLGDVLVSRVTPAPAKGGDVSLSFGGSSLVLLPTNADALLQQHEPGHSDIFEYYWCVCFKAVAKKAVEKAICNTTFADADALKKTAKEAAFQAARDFVKAVGEHGKYEDDYDTATNSGTEGDQPAEVKKQQDEILKKTKAAFPDAGL